MNNKRWLLLALLVSVALNIAIAGFFLGKYLNSYPIRSPEPLWDIGLGQYIGALPTERRQELASVVSDARGKLRGSLAPLRDSQDALMKVLLTDPLDQQALQEQLAEFRRKMMEARERHDGVYIRLMASLTVEERRRIIEQMSKRDRHKDLRQQSPRKLPRRLNERERVRPQRNDDRPDLSEDSSL